MVRSPAPVGLHEFIVKIHSRCNLSCADCYMYRASDQSWAARPFAMSEQIMGAIVDRLVDYVRRHRPAFVTVMLHGGEPLLAGVERIVWLTTRLRRGFAGLPTALNMVLQTNGVLLDEAFLEAFRRHEVSVGVSVDGARQAHDRRRSHRSGRGSHAEVVRGLGFLRHPRYLHLYAGLLCTVDLQNSPQGTYEALLEHAPPQVNFLLPHGTWDNPPPGLPASGTPYADWLIEAFDRWYRDHPRETRVRLFDSVVDLCLGGSSSTELVGADGATSIVVETDGAIEWHDTLKVVGPGEGSTGRNIMEHGFDDLPWPSADLCRTCQDCDVVDVCGGGLRTHRYSASRGFDNPSVYCRDLERLIAHVRERLRAEGKPTRRGGEVDNTRTKCAKAPLVRRESVSPRD